MGRRRSGSRRALADVLGVDERETRDWPLAIATVIVQPSLTTPHGQSVDHDTSWTAFPESATVLVATTDPVWSSAPFIAPFGHEVQIVIVNIQLVVAAVVA